MTWNDFTFFAIISAFCWTGSSILAFLRKKNLAIGLDALGCIVFLIFIIGVWLNIGRPPLRTIGETRLWYSLFLSLIGLGVFLNHRYNWMLAFCNLMAIVFLCINIFKPEIHDQHLMPALQSPWFVPHVIVYMVAYAFMGAATAWSLIVVWKDKRLHEQQKTDDLKFCDTLMHISWGFLTMGIVMGALWAKQAWGDWWTWDPKETWAAATWFSCLLYIHIKPHLRSVQNVFWLILFCFLLLQVSWWGVNYLPSAQGASLHTY